jgi:hypothetical protein
MPSFIARSATTILLNPMPGCRQPPLPPAGRTLPPRPSGPEFYDVAVVGGGIVGLATAREVLGRFPNKRVVVLEKEPEVALSQSGCDKPQPTRSASALPRPRCPSLVNYLGDNRGSPRSALAYCGGVLDHGTSLTTPCAHSRPHPRQRRALASRHNSGVIHAGIHLTPGTLVAKCVVNGGRLMYKYCEVSGWQWAALTTLTTESHTNETHHTTHPDARRHLDCRARESGS